MSNERVTRSRGTFALEQIDLRQSQLLKLVVVVTACGWLYFLFSGTIPWPPEPDGVPMILVLMFACAGALWLRHAHFSIASWLLLLGMIAVISLITIAHPDSLAIVLGALVIVAASTLLGPKEALATLLLGWLSSVLAVHLSVSSVQSDLGRLGQVLLLYGLVFVTATIAHSPLQTSVEWALSAWEQVHDALLEARQRRAEIYRVARALDEATYRIERMNNELIVARREAEVAKANKVRFAATVSHEIRGPLNLILGFSRLMTLSPERYGIPLPSSYRADIDTIYLNSQHLASLVDDVLDLSQIDMATLPLVRDLVDLEKDVLSDCVESVRSLVERKGLYLRVLLGQDLPRILADKARLRQVVINLLTNAVRFTERGGIAVRAERNQHELTISIQDTGRGMPANELPRLFEEFHRLEMERTAGTTKGTGLGLPISKHLVELHGGRMWAESTEGVGTTFSFALPLPDAKPNTHQIVGAGESRQTTPPYQICLIAHSDPATVRLLARHIEGYRVVGVPHEHLIKSLARELHPRAIITTPSLDQSVRSQLLELPFDVPVICCPMPDMSQSTFDDGTLSYLIKPITTDMVESTIRRLERDGETTVMIVDDDPDAVRLLEIMLNSLSRPYRILKAYDGLQALEIMKDAVPDVVLLDLVMPGMDGRETIARMRIDERLRGIPVIIISAMDPSDRVMTLGMPIVVWSKRTLEISKGVKCLRALLDVLSPQYLSGQEQDRGPSVSDAGIIDVARKVMAPNQWTPDPGPTTGRDAGQERNFTAPLTPP